MIKKKSAIMVALSAVVIAPMYPSNALAGITISCPVTFKLGKIVGCDFGGRVTIDPDGNVKSLVGCANLLDTPQPAQCIIKTDGTPVVTNVKVDFASASVTMKFGGNNFVLDKLRMTYTGKTTPTATIILTPAEVTGVGVTVNIGGRINPAGNHTLNNTYSGDIIVRANTI